MKNISMVTSGLDVGLGEEGEDFAAGEFLDRVGEAFGDHVLEFVAHRDDPVGLP